MTDVQPLVFINGKACGVLDACDRGLFYGDGLFETCKLFNGVIPLWPYHEQRLLGSAACLNISIKNNEIVMLVNAALESALTLGVVAGVVKVVLTRGVGGRGYQLPSVTEPTIIVYVFPDATACVAPNPITLGLCDLRLGKNPKLAGHKHLNRLENVLAREQVTQMHLDEGLLRDSDESLIECTAHNFFAFMGNQLVTPAMTACGVRGVMRELIIQELACELGIEVYERNFSMTDLMQADAVFICNSNKGITAVERVIDETAQELVRYNQDLRITGLQQALIKRYPAYKQP